MRFGWGRRDAQEPAVAVILPEPLAGQVRALLAAGERIQAVRLVRRRTDLTLLPAVRAVDAVAADDGA
jgi:hypothetical protein